MTPWWTAQAAGTLDTLVDDAGDARAVASFVIPQGERYIVSWTGASHHHIQLPAGVMMRLQVLDPMPDDTRAYLAFLTAEGLI